MLRDGLLDGLTVAFAGAAAPIADACARLGAATPALRADAADEEAVADACARLGAPDTLVCATAPAFAAAGGGLDGLRVAADAAFIATRAVANAWIAGERGGKIVLLAPGPDAAPAEGATVASPTPAGAAPLRASLENLARSLSIEWARFGIRPTAVLPGAASADEDVATLVAFLASRGGDYYSGCAFTLR